ncbi:LPS export ABC transporter periplasmic protein LptC [Candidatus Tisiphia endosymbiont of Nemotelus uliginosus]|uniref:LPS export ABC transporter periplasmic protein LptC n=1 Tax=Candidatus Tisiphia endosymbiont of Nemotelus uliginosus TaxID=3077926 RepID=UPI0035C8A677
MKNNITNTVILRKYIRYKRLNGLSKILTLLGVLLILYFIYISLKWPINIIAVPQNDNIEENVIAGDKQSHYPIKIGGSTFSGVNKNLNPYEINTTTAVRTTDNNYLLEKIAAKYQMNNAEELMVSAKDGILNEATQVLELNNNVQFLLGDGILATPKAQLNLLNKEIYSEAGVVLFFKASSLKANNFSATHNNMLLNFRGQVSTSINISDF